MMKDVCHQLVYWSPLADTTVMVKKYKCEWYTYKGRR